VLTLPRTAISFFAYGESVFTIEESGDALTVQRQPVKVGRTRDEQVEILSGLEAGQRVVHTGHIKLRDSQAIVIDDGIALPQGLDDR
jgi:membrane fusion protein (multidrug efflux system)